MTHTIRHALALLALAAGLVMPAARADEPQIALKQAPGLPAVETNCAGCHSLDYIQTNSPFLAPAAWDAEVKKMINAFGAPIAPDDAKTITEYLVKNYGS